jgi:hypothetical protein
MTHSKQTERTIVVATEVSRLIAAEGARTAVIGAVAMAVHGYARATGDLDLATELDPTTQLEPIRRELERRGYRTRLSLPDAEDPLGGVLTVSGDDFDDVQVINFYNPFLTHKTPATQALDAAVPLPGTELRVVSVEDLILFKLYAGGIRSLADAVGLLEANPDLDLETLRPRCRDLGLEADLDRLQAELP